MPNRHDIVHLFPSTTWEFRKVKIAGPRPGKTQHERSESRSYRIARRDERKPLNVEIRYAGGPEAHWVLKSRGRTLKAPGSLCLHDVLSEVNAAFWKPATPG